MKIYRVLLILLVILMGCSQQASKEKAGKKPGITKTGNKKRKQKGIKQKKLDEKPVDDEINDNDDGEEDETSDNDDGEEDEISDNDTGKEDNLGDIGGATLYATLEKKVKELRGKHEIAKNKFEKKYPFPSEEELNRLFPKIQEPGDRTAGSSLSKDYPFFNIVKLMMQQPSYKSPDEMDDIYAGLEYDAGLLAGVDKIITKLNHKGQSKEPTWFYYFFLFYIGEVGEFNREVLYEYFSDATLTKLKSGSEADIAKANELLDEFMKKKEDSVELFKEQIKAVENKEKRDDFFSEFIKPRLDEIKGANGKLEKSRDNIKNFVRIWIISW
ncbi:hypothetical protein DB313_04955 (plasmid) [Borrelia turcica IST7]|uniref:Mlp family lipoprotein n=1 Tax=Borrelia turcica IST7 TaxID=1104446 RepID=A0A386PQ55_9SPIR|nr:hypothetical protein [Borrelia turcica]AYE36850.1 hypothetical protein DB313_04955 [Borrelia turcica IST7]